MQTVERKDHEHNEVGNHQREVEGVGVVHAGKSFVSDPVPKVADGALGHEKDRE